MQINGKTFKQQYRKCCRTCTHGPAGIGHGPYWYSSGVGEALHYVGKKLPVQVQEHLELVKENLGKLDELRAILGKQAAQLYAQARHVDELKRAVESVQFVDSQNEKLLEELKLKEFICLV